MRLGTVILGKFVCEIDNHSQGDFNDNIHSFFDIRISSTHASIYPFSGILIKFIFINSSSRNK